MKIKMSKLANNNQVCILFMTKCMRA